MFNPITTITEFWEAASKVLHLDSSHDAIRSKLQEHVAAEHRKVNAASDSASYYDHPYVRDVYGNEDTGHVITSHKGKMTMAKFQKQGDGSYKMSGHKGVKQAYVSDNDADDKKESLEMLLDGRELIVQESAVELSEVLELQEAKSGAGKITLITAGKGNSGYYTEASLKKAAGDKIFDTGTQMFLNHQTKEERLSRPEGDVTKLAAVLTTPAVYVEGSGATPGRLVANAKIYPEYKDFIEARKDDIGVSIRVGATPSGKVQEGVPLVEHMVYAVSADFVTKAGRGGKIEELYESYRGTNPAQRQPAASGEENMTDQEKALFTSLQESVTRLNAQVDRLNEANEKLSAGNLIAESLANSGLTPRAQARVRTVVLANVPMKDGVIDTAKLQESLTATIKDEAAYLQEAGVTRPKVVRFQGAVPTTNDKGDELTEAEIKAKAETLLTESISPWIGKEKSA